MPIGADTPEEIAVSAMGEIIAVRRGASLAQGWTPPVPKAAGVRGDAESASAREVANPDAQQPAPPGATDVEPKEVEKP